MKKYLHIILAFQMGACAAFADNGEASKNKSIVKGQHGEIGNMTETVSGHTAHPDAQWFPDAGLGLFLHWGICSVEAMNISWPMMVGARLPRIEDPTERDRIIREKDWELKGQPEMTPMEYWAMAEKFNPQNYHPATWLAAAKASGFEYVVLTTKHHEGFAMWPSAFGDFNTKNYMGGRDLVKEFVDGCRKAEIRVGLYYSPPDWYFDRENVNFTHRNLRKSNPELSPLDYNLQPKGPSMEGEELVAHQKAYAEMVSGQIRELLTNYGKIDVLWFDGNPKVGEYTKLLIGQDEMRRLQPGMVINPRMGGKGDFRTFERHLPENPELKDGEWAEFCNTWNFNWPYVDKDYRHFNRVLDELIRCRIHGINYLLGIGPKADGDLCYRAYEGFELFEDWMSTNGESVNGVHLLAENETCSTHASQKSNVRYVYLMPSNIREDRVPQPETVEFNGLPKPKKVFMLHNGQSVPFEFNEGQLIISVANEMQTKYADVIKVEL
ncbi:alpha-L-fucosidase [Pontiella sulfatireligans]|nr:alpha-L-fucosidase [Pontiella sulfatireligans]